MITVAASFLSQLALVYVPFMQAIFQTESLPLDDLFLLLALAASSFLLHESRRRYELSLNQRETYVSAMEELA
jgi:P-type Ca2+ transporter type 2C